ASGAGARTRAAPPVGPGHARAIRARRPPPCARSADSQRSPLGEVKLRDLTPDHVAEWSQRNEQTLARDTAQVALIALNHIFRFAVRRGWIGANPVACLEPGEKP